MRVKGIAVFVLAGMAAVLLWAKEVRAVETALTSSSYHHEEASWSPDGQWITYVRNDASGYRHVWKVQVTGGPETQLTAGTLYRNNPSWAPDDSAIAYERLDADGYRRIYKVSPSGGAETLITTDPEHYQGFNPNWSPDSSMLTLWVNKLVGPAWICTVSATGGNYNWLISPSISPIYSHAGDRIAIACPSSPDICSIPSNGGSVTQITNDAYGEYMGELWSFSDSKIVYVKIDSSNFRRIYSVPSNGGSETLLTPDNNDYGGPSFSPDDKFILFQKAVGLTNQIYFMRSDGSGQTPITNDSYDNVLPRWSPDGTKVLYLKTDATGYRQIYIFTPMSQLLIPTLSEVGLFALFLVLLAALFLTALRRTAPKRAKE